MTFAISFVVLSISMIIVPSLLELLNALTFLRIEGMTMSRKVYRGLLYTSIRISSCFALLLAIFIPASFALPDAMGVPYAIFGTMMLLILLIYWYMDHLALHDMRLKRTRIWCEISFSARENKEKMILRALRIMRIAGTVFFPITLVAISISLLA
ncbi:MAG: hypothetical protein ACLFTR_03540 [Candidatus Woesearchaeota archaeon]